MWENLLLWRQCLVCFGFCVPLHAIEMTSRWAHFHKKKTIFENNIENQLKPYAVSKWNDHFKCVTKIFVLIDFQMLIRFQK